MAMVSSFADDGPSFFTLKHSRRIPARFKGIIGKGFPCVIYLKGSSSDTQFEVVVHEDDNGRMAMQKGFQNFVLANEISISNFLLFHYDGHISFRVQVFNPSGMERVPENQEQHEAIATSDGKRKRGRPRKNGREDHMLQATRGRGYQVSAMEPCKKIPAFFKAFIAQDDQRRLNIPLAFTEYIEGMISFTAFLRNRKSDVWSVKATKRRNQYSFDDGWPTFVEENDVQLGDFLVFQYDGKWTFDFKHFGSSMCEKEAKVNNFKVKEEYEDENDKTAETADKKYADLDKFYDDGYDEDDDDNYDEDDNDVVVVEKDVDEDSTMKKSDNDENDLDYNDEDDDNNDEDEEDDNDVVVEETDVNEEVFKKESDQDDANNEERRIFGSGLVEKPKTNPYFVTKILPSRQSELAVPSCVIKDFGLELPENLFIHDENGRRWETKVKVWKDGRTCLSEGWRRFCKWNSVQLNDRCLCEFVPGHGGNDVFLCIRIVRAGSW